MIGKERLVLWDQIERTAQALVKEMDAAAGKDVWRDEDIESWGEVYDALSRRPKLTLAERDKLSGRFDR